MRNLFVLLTIFCAGESLWSDPQFDRLAAQAKAAREQDRLNDAALYYRQALALNPSWKEGLWYASTILYDQQRYAEACEGFRRFIALEPKAGEGLSLLGLCEFQIKQYQEALGHLNLARTLGVANGAVASAALYHYALLLTRFEQFDLAGQTLLGIVARGEMPPSLIEAAGLAGLRKPILPAEVRPEDAEMISVAGRAMCAAVVHKDLDASRGFARLAADYAGQPNVHYLRGSFLLPTDPEMALTEFQNELRLNPNHVPALVAVAMDYLNHDNPSKGLPFAEKAVQNDAQSLPAHVALGKALADSHEYERAIQQLKIAVQLAPDSPQVRIALASAYAKAGKSKEAAQERAEFLRLRKLSESSESK